MSEFLSRTGDKKSQSDKFKKVSTTFFFQPKLKVNQPDDIYEQEADAMADKVMRMRSEINDKTFFRSADMPNVQRMCQDCEEEETLQRKEISSGDYNSDHKTLHIADVINSKGNRLSEADRKFFEPRFGYDFSDVRIHTDDAAARSAESINANAYTSGKDIVFNKTQYSPQSESGKRLLAHELTHVVQQNDFISRDFKDKEGEGICGGEWTCATKSGCLEPDNPEDGPFESDVYEDELDNGFIINVYIDIEEESLDDIDTDGNVGHTYIKFEDINGAEYTFGFYPNKKYGTPDPSGIFGNRTAPGCVVHPDKNHEYCVDYKESYIVNRGEFLLALKKAQSMCGNPPVYHILNYNCTTWANDILKESGNTLPNMKGTVHIPLAGDFDVDNPNTLYDSFIERDNKLIQIEETKYKEWEYRRYPDGTWHDRDGRMQMGPGVKW